MRLGCGSNTVALRPLASTAQDCAAALAREDSPLQLLRAALATAGVEGAAPASTNQA